MEERIKKVMKDLKDILEELYKERRPTEKKEFKPTEEQIERWKKIAPTKKTIGYLIKNGFTEEEIKHIKTQYDCYVILENLKEKNI